MNQSATVDRVLVVRLNAKPRNITLIQVYGPTTAAMHEEMERFYQDLSQAVKQVPNRDTLLIMGDFNAKVGRREPSAMSSTVGLYGLGETVSSQLRPNSLTLSGSQTGPRLVADLQRAGIWPII